MLLDFDTSSHMPAEADICIIGAGAAGLTLARELTKAPSRRVLLLESGTFQLNSETQNLYSGDAAGTFFPRKKNRYLLGSRLRFFGGSTNHWTGWVHPFDEIDFLPREWVPHSGWPFELQQLNPYYERAQRFLKLQALIQRDIPKSDYTPSLLDAESDFEERIFQISPRRLGPELRDELSAIPNLDLLLNANALEIVSSGNRISHIKIASLTGKRAAISARTYILACGGIENARILLASTSGAPKGLGNENDLVGRFFSDHPHVPTAFLALSGFPLAKRYKENHFESLGYNLLSVLRLKTKSMERERLLNCTVQFQNIKRNPLPPELQKLGLALAREGKADASVSAEEAILSVFLRSEQSPNPESRVQLDSRRDALGIPRARLDWRVSNRDHEMSQRAVALLAKDLARLGVGRLLSRIDRGQGWPPNARGGYHHMGTTRMHRDPHFGVVDEHCRLHSRENLFIAGSSVFPTTSAVNPTLTIIALAMRLADHLNGNTK